MKKVILKTLFATSLLSITQTEARNFTGFSIGANLGSTFTKTDYAYNDDTNNPGYTIKGAGHGFHGNGVGGLVLGINNLFANCLYMGAEIFVDGNFGGKSDLFSNQALSFKAKKSGASYGILAKIGGTISQNTLLYIGVGGKSDKWGYTVFSSDAAAAPKFTQSKRSFRLLAEAGMEGYFASSKNVTWRAAYQYVPGKALSSKKFPALHPLYNAAGNSFSKLRTHDHTLRLGVAYHF